MLSKNVFDDYYNGCCNATFWPLFHSMPDRALFQADKWEVRFFIKHYVLIYLSFFTYFNFQFTAEIHEIRITK